MDFRLNANDDFKAMVGSTLIPASIDVAIASARLVAADRSNMWVPAHALFRIQMEHFSRGAFFLGVASQNQARRFLAEDVLPKRTFGLGKKKPIWPRRMVDECSSWYEWGDGFCKMFDGLNDGLNSLVHGGRSICNIYWDAEKVGFDKVSEQEACDLLVNPLSLAAQGVVVLMRYEGFSVEGDVGRVRSALDGARSLLYLTPNPN